MRKIFGAYFAVIVCFYRRMISSIGSPIEMGLKGLTAFLITIKYFLIGC